MIQDKIFKVQLFINEITEMYQYYYKFHSNIVFACCYFQHFYNILSFLFAEGVEYRRYRQRLFRQPAFPFSKADHALLAQTKIKISDFEIHQGCLCGSFLAIIIGKLPEVVLFLLADRNTYCTQYIKKLEFVWHRWGQFFTW